MTTVEELTAQYASNSKILHPERQGAGACTKFMDTFNPRELTGQGIQREQASGVFRFVFILC